MNRKTVWSTKRYSRLKIIVLVVICFCVLLHYVIEHMYILSLEAKVFNLQQENVVLDRTIKDFELNVAELSKGGRIKNLASDMGMTVPLGPPQKLF
jgi:cell division protein FtsL